MQIYSRKIRKKNKVGNDKKRTRRKRKALRLKKINLP